MVRRKKLTGSQASLQRRSILNPGWKTKEPQPSKGNRNEVKIAEGKQANKLTSQLSQMDADELGFINTGDLTCRVSFDTFSNALLI